MDFLSPMMFIVGVALTAVSLFMLRRAQVSARKRADELHALSVLGQMLRASMSLRPLLNTVYLQVTQLLEVEDFAIALYDQETGRLKYPLAIQHGAQVHPAVSGVNTLADHVLQTQTPLAITRDVQARAQRMGLTSPDDSVVSWLGVPLVSAGRALGVMIVTSQNPQRRLGADDLRLMNIVAANTSVALDNVQFNAQQSERVAQLGALNRILALLTGTLSSDAVLDTVISSASLIADATAVAVYMFWDGSRGRMALVRYAGLSDAFSVDAPDPLLVTHADAQTLDQRKPMIVNDVRRDERTAHVCESMLREGKAAWIELPLFIGEVYSGALVLYFDKPHTFAGERIELLRTFANQVSQAINNARLYTLTDEALERRVAQLLALSTIGRELIAVTDRNTICDLILEYALRSTRASVGAIILRDDTDQEMRVITQHGYPAGTSAAIIRGIPGRVFQTGQIARSDDVRADPEYLPLLPTMRSQLTVPIRRGSDSLGVITLESDQLQAFSEEDSHFINQLASQTIIAIDNARLFRDVSTARDRLQAILDNMDEAIMLLNPNGMIALANPRVDLLGFHPEQLLNQHIDYLLMRLDLMFAERIGFESADEVRQLFHESPAHWLERDPVTYSIAREHRLVYLQRQVIPVWDAHGQLETILLVFRDETEQRELELMREDLSRMIVHDMRSPLTAVTSGLKLLKDLVPSDSHVRPAVESTTEASQRALRKLLNRVDSLLDISKLESGQLTLEIGPVGLAGLVDGVCLELSPLAQELEVSLLRQVPDTVPLLLLDGDKIERVLLNLVDNALKFSPNNTSVVIRTYEPGTHDAPDTYVRVDVIDSGPGVPDEHKTRLFDRFAQIEGQQGRRRGTGLGLAFCRLAVQAHGGHIWIEDNPAGGTIFAFTLPVAPDFED
jgi:two-component system, NtrC family, sensor histidine kinase KinB